MLSKRKLLKWRKDALMFKEDIESIPATTSKTEIQQLDRLLELTQVLIDQYLLKEN